MAESPTKLISDADRESERLLDEALKKAGLTPESLADMFGLRRKKA